MNTRSWRRSSSTGAGEVDFGSPTALKRRCNYSACAVDDRYCHVSHPIKALLEFWRDRREAVFSFWLKHRSEIWLMSAYAT